MIEPRSVVHFSIAVSDLDVSRKFYTEILGLTLVQNAPAGGMVFLRAGNDHVILARSDAPLRREPKDSRRAHHAFKVDADKYEAAKTFLASKGVEVFEEEHRDRGVFVGRQLYIRDPDGTVIELTEWDGTSKLD
jgi:catechol 2,3-dioxygenase-like lactoylglutathione lyase family enzyme